MSTSGAFGNYIDKLRNIGIIAHIDAGKTTLTERILYYSGKIHRMGEVHEGTATMDYMPEEQERGITITSALTTAQWNGRVINIIDTPGHVDFTIEVERSLRVLDGAVGVFCGVSGVEPQSETVWRQSETYKVPKLAFVNKLDRLGADYAAVLDSMVKRLKANPLPIQVPDGQGQELAAIFDLVTMERLIFDPDEQGADYKRQPMTEAEAERVEPWRERMFNTLSDADDEFCECYLGDAECDTASIKGAIRRATLAGLLVPILAGSALKNIGVQPVMDAICDYLPSPAEVETTLGTDPTTGKSKSFPPSPGNPLSALVYKVTMDSGRKLALMRIYSGRIKAGDTVMNITQGENERVARLFKLHAGRREKVDVAVAGEIIGAAGMKFSKTGDTLCLESDPLILEQIVGYKPVISLAIEPQNSEEADKLDEVLEKYLLEDPTLALEKDEATGQVILSGMGELHLEVILERLKREYKLQPRTGNPQVVYQETVFKAANGKGVFLRELGEVMHFGGVDLRVEPRERAQGVDIIFEVDLDQWPDAWIQAVEDGVSDGLQSGVVKGYPVRDVRVRITTMTRKDGESSPAGYRMAAAMALKEALEKADPQLLEPIMWLDISVPEEFTGDVVSLLGAKGAKIENMLDRAGVKAIQALAPLASLFGFSTQIRSATQGRASFVMKFSRFDVLD